MSASVSPGSRSARCFASIWAISTQAASVIGGGRGEQVVEHAERIRRGGADRGVGHRLAGDLQVAAQLHRIGTDHRSGHTERLQHAGEVREQVAGRREQRRHHLHSATSRTDLVEPRRDPAVPHHHQGVLTAHGERARGVGGHDVPGHVVVGDVLDDPGPAQALGPAQQAVQRRGSAAAVHVRGDGDDVRATAQRGGGAGFTDPGVVPPTRRRRTRRSRRGRPRWR